MAESVPDPSYVRYSGPGEMYAVRYQIGPYRVLCEAPKGVPVAVPPDVADALVAGREFEPVDPVEAAAEIVAHEQHLAEQQAEWEVVQAAVRARKQRHRQLAELEGARLEAMRTAALAIRETGGTDAEIVAAAASSDHEFRRGITDLDDEG